jgi:hypothetical protein
MNLDELVKIVAAESAVESGVVEKVVKATLRAIREQTASFVIDGLIIGVTAYDPQSDHPLPEHPFPDGGPGYGPGVG